MTKFLFVCKNYLAIVFVLLLGAANSCYLFWMHFLNYTDLTYVSFCAISKSLNCDTVAQSDWSILFGLPVAAWGCVGYLLYLLVFLLGLLKEANNKPFLWSFLVVLSGIFSAVSLFFIYISTVKIDSYCLLCMGSYIINFTLLFLSWRTWCSLDGTEFFSDFRNIFQIKKQSRFLSVVFIPIIFVIIGLYIFVPKYWQFQSFSLITDNVLTGFTEEGYPWIGAKKPKIIINEYTDYQCFQCYKTHSMLRMLIADNPNKIRLVHHHYPMDNEVNSVVVPAPFHVGSGKMAKLAIYAMSKDKFWETNDILYEIGRTKKTIDVSLIADRVGIPAREFAWALESKEVAERLRYDIWHGMKLGITGTPTFVIDGEVYTGFIPPEILQKALGR